ncbi:DNA methyltransferase [Winogradskyella sp. SYSU M77433]|uniref:DNA methyltransferase n=1 Tax=Winogradskyella sp. SYSU M77433 TaxID=3042722 RepID=UPI00247FE8D5|nr:DNA methyltransferase [Winogradskyella sp. SYSU M77433]MDH7914649.1 DNA methyltransferase [Winogradskyella sp. SYSU M77433]
MKSTGTTFKNIREERKLLLEDVTKKTGINKTLLSRIENGKRLPTREQLNLLCKCYKIEKDEIVVQWLSDKIVYEIKDEDLALPAMMVAEEKIKYGTNGHTHQNGYVLSLNGKKKKRPIEDFVNKVIQGDCLEVMQSIPDKSVDMVLCDLPYGTTQNKWDSVIDLEKLWAEYERIVKDNGAIVLTSQGVFTAKLILSNEKSFKYKITWIKSKSTNFLNAKKQPLRKHEDICVFYKKQPKYNPQMTDGEAYDKGIRKDQYTGSYGDFKPRHVKSNGKRYPNDVVFYEEQPIDDYVYVKTAESEGTVYHPTQKPIELGRYLIKTFTNQGDIVLDNACGSGSFLLSAILENRNFIGIEKNEDVLLHKVKPVDYIKVCTDRIEETLKTKKIKEATLRLFKEPIAEYHTLNYEIK